MIIKEDGIMWSLQKHEAIEYLEELIASDSQEGISIQDSGLGEYVPEPTAEWNFYSSKKHLSHCLATIKNADIINSVNTMQYDQHLSLHYHYSTCELTDASGMLEILIKDFPQLKEAKRIYLLNRIKTAHHRQGKGDGERLLVALAALADKQGFHIISSINAYGKLSHKDLQAWYEKHGFVYFEDKNIILRAPETDN